jgi:methanol:N,N-dimethyl-4-nitrosoaniline oxidoreductase
MDIGRYLAFPLKQIHPLPPALIGPGAHEMIGTSAKDMGFRRPLVMTTGLRGTGTVEAVMGQLQHHGLEPVLFDGIESNPKDRNVMAAHATYVANGCDSFISLGGGSSHDATKATRMVVASDGRLVNELAGSLALHQPTPPHIAVTTTAGTGSETSFAFVITDTTTDPANPRKWIAGGYGAVASLAILDPVLHYTMPADLTAYCGMDVLAHAIGAYVSILDSPTAPGQALRAVELVGQHLRSAVANPLDARARSGMLDAQYLAGVAFNAAGLDAIHSVSHAVSAYHDTHHGLGNGIAMVPVCAYNVSLAPEKYARIGAALGLSQRGRSTVQAADDAIAAIVRMCDDVAIPENFASTGPYTKSRVGLGSYAAAGLPSGDDAAQVERIAQHALNDACSFTNPRALTLESMSGIVRRSIAGSRR